MARIGRSAKLFGSRPLLARLARGIGDDAALFRPTKGYQTVLTCDWFLEGTHFLRLKHPADSVGWKCLARAVSDVAAMGGVPRCFLLSLAFPTTLAGRWMDKFLSGLRRASRKFGCVLAGGDTTRRKHILINVTVVGEVRAGRAVLRTGAKPGDLIYVSGRLGEAELGLEVLRARSSSPAKNNRILVKHLYPEPRLALGQWLAQKRFATSMIDVSDGLSTDLSRLCTASDVGALLNAADFPIAEVPPRLQSKIRNPLDLALHGGDDYELLFTAAPGNFPAKPWRFHDLAITPIGQVTSGRRVFLTDGTRSRRLALHPGGWDPFRKSP